MNIHTTVDPGGEIRAQMETETYHFSPTMSSGNETARVSPDASGASWLTVVVDRDAKGAISGGTVTFDVDCDLGGPTKVVAMHIHHGPAGVNGPVVIGSGIAPITSATGKGNITASARISSSDTTALSALAGLLANPADYYLNLHSDAYPAGLMRSQLLPDVSFEPQLAGGGQWMTLLTLANPSSTTGVDGLVEIFDRNGNPMPAGIIDPVIPFALPPSGTVTFGTLNVGALTDGYARIHSSAPVTSGVGYAFDGLPGVPAVSGAIGRWMSIPVVSGSGGSLNIGIALLDLDLNPPTAILTLRDSSGAPVPGASVALRFSSGKRIVGFLDQLLPAGLKLGDSFSGSLSIQLNYGPFPGGLMSAVALRFDAAGVTPVAIQVNQ